jgi:hypothetical protein
MVDFATVPRASLDDLDDARSSDGHEEPRVSVAPDGDTAVALGAVGSGHLPARDPAIRIHHEDRGQRRLEFHPSCQPVAWEPHRT